jgi:hypothetical protein
MAYVAGRDDLFLIVRVHPRDYPNKRDPLQSEQAALWEKMFESRPGNVAINWPQDKIALYPLFGQVDAVLTGWSATGTEALGFGIPVVTYDRLLPSYPSDVHFTGESEAEYYANIEKALATGHGEQHMRHGLRWLAASFSMGTVRVPPETIIGRNWPRNIAARALSKGLRLLLGSVIRRRDARRGMHPADAKRFSDFVLNGDDSLFETIVREPHTPLAPERLNDVIRNEMARILASGENGS